MNDYKAVYFVSDVHLGFFERQIDAPREKLLLDFFESIKSPDNVLVIAGDLFDYWFEYDKVVPKDYYLTLAKLKELRQAGMDIIYVMGNHDFGHKSFFAEELDIIVYKHDIEREFFGKKFYISHGDGKAYNDQLYLMMRSILRNSIAQAMFNKLHPDFGIKIALGSSRKSRNYTKKRDYGEKEGMTDFAKAKIDEGFDYVVMGHRHIADIIEHGNGKYVNLGEWLSNPHFAKFDGKEMKLIEILRDIPKLK